MSHECTVPWCANGDTNETDHWQHPTYVPGRLSIADPDVNGATLPSICAGAGTIEGTPAVYVHVAGGKHDAQADLTLNDAERLLEQLQQAVANAHQLVVTTD